MELCEAHWRGQNAAAQGRTVKGQDRGAVGQHQERTPTCPVILPSTNCRLYYRLLSKCRRPTCCFPHIIEYRTNDIFLQAAVDLHTSARRFLRSFSIDCRSIRLSTSLLQ